MTTEVIRLKKPHSLAQRTLIEYEGNVVAFCGRRWGKTDGLVARLFRGLSRRPGLYWWIGLNWRSASMKRAWRETTAIAYKILAPMGLDPRRHINHSDSEIRIPGMGEIWFRTAENPSSLAGEGIMGAVIDEFSLMREVVWVEFLQATLLDYGGWAAFGGVPKGNNWAANLWRAAASRPGWKQLHATTYDNPFIGAAAIDKIRGDTAERFFNQEYLALITDDAGSVFRKVLAAATLDEQPPVKDHQYVMGVDLGRKVDFTVCTVLDVSVTPKQLVAMDRFNTVEWSLQVQRIKILAERFGVSQVIVDQTGLGDPVLEDLRNALYL